MAAPAPKSPSTILSLGDALQRASSLDKRLDSALEQLVATKVLDRLDADSPLARLHDRVKEMLGGFQESIRECEKGETAPFSEVTWDPMKQTRRRNTITISGPGAEHICQIDASRLTKEQVTCVMGFHAALTEICDEAKSLSKEVAVMSRDRREKEKPKSLKRSAQASAEEVDHRGKQPRTEVAAQASKTRAQLLQEYNEVKDIGQQLIGMVAEHRGVPIGSLYENEEFGVSPDD